MVKPQSTGTDGGPKVKDLEDCYVLLHIGQPRKGTVTYKGKSSLKTIVPCDTWKITFAPDLIEHLGVVRFLQDVLVEKLIEEGPGSWRTTKIIKPGQAYLFETLTESQQKVADQLCEEVPDTDHPSLRLGEELPDNADDDDLDEPSDGPF